MGPDLVAAPAQKVEASLVDVVVDVLVGDPDILLGEEALIAADEAEHFRVLSKQAVDDVVAAWTLPAVETNPDSYLLV